jgi:uncharacterized membrane protein
MDDGKGSDEMTRTVMDTASLNELAAIEAGTRFFMRLLIGAGVAAALLVATGVVVHQRHHGDTGQGPGPATHEGQTLQIGPA